MSDTPEMPGKKKSFNAEKILKSAENTPPTKVDDGILSPYRDEITTNVE